MARAIDELRWYHSNRYAAETACEHCAGVVRHEPWCITRNANVAYAYAALLDADKLSLEDSLVLHALGIAWTNIECNGKTCKGR